MLRLVAAAPHLSLCLVQVSNTGRAEGTGSCLKTSLVAALLQVLERRMLLLGWDLLKNPVVRFPPLRSWGMVVARPSPQLLNLPTAVAGGQEFSGM